VAGIVAHRARDREACVGGCFRVVLWAARVNRTEELRSKSNLGRSSAYSSVLELIVLGAVLFATHRLALAWYSSLKGSHSPSRGDLLVVMLSSLYE
jgi:hypothetical protein